MTGRQRELARHALGFQGSGNKVSYRNRFVTGPGHTDYEDWTAMVEAGEAKRRDGKTLPFGGDDMFWLTKAGALLALNPGERLDPQDFPQ
jgi:hypothetical protein